MPERFLSSEEYDEQAHKLYNDGDYDGALKILKEGLALYPNALDLYVGLGYAQLAREEYAWARRAFEAAVVLDPSHEDANVGLGEVLLRFGEQGRALALFKEVVSNGHENDINLMLTIGRALYKAEMYTNCRDIFAQVALAQPTSADAAASLGYALHRLGDEVGAARQVRRALKLDPDLYEARVYLGHLLYDRGDWEAALREFEQVPPPEHWDALGVWRLIELKRTLWHMNEGDPRLSPWAERLHKLEDSHDPIDRLLSEVEIQLGVADVSVDDSSQLELFERSPSSTDRDSLTVRLTDGHLVSGNSQAIVCQMRDRSGFSHETLLQYMRRFAERWHEQRGVEIPFTDPEVFLRAAIQVGLITLEVEG